MQSGLRIWCGDRDGNDFLPPPDWAGAPAAADAEDLPYRVEVWDESGTFPETLVAVSSTASLGYAAYYAAAREFFGREVTLTHKGLTLARWRIRTN